MDDLISREAALDICQKEYEERLRMFDYCGDTVAWNIGGRIKSLPTVDAALVVRCHECKHQIHDQECGKRWCTRELGCREVRADGQGYCDLGARMDGGQGDG